MHMLQMLTTQPKKKCAANKMHLVVLWAFAVCFFIWLCCEHLHICCQNDENVFLICWCFFYLHVFSEVAAHWALSATVCLTEWWQLFSVELYYSWNLCNLINEFLSIWFFCFTVKLLWNGQYCIKCCINKCNMYLFIYLFVYYIYYYYCYYYLLFWYYQLLTQVNWWVFIKFEPKSSQLKEPKTETTSVCVHWIYLIREFHNLSWITEINELFHDILIYWDAPVFFIYLF